MPTSAAFNACLSPDGMHSTLGNVTDDLAATAVVARWFNNMPLR